MRISSPFPHILAVAAATLCACGEEAVTPTAIRQSDCITNTTAPCLCLNGRAGVQTCQADGSYSACECPGDCDAGLVIESGACVDLDECDAGLDDCDPNADCRNGHGGFSCHCNAGFSGDGRTCTDVDECATGTDDCGPNTLCDNNPGSFTCACAPGFYGDGLLCDDVDECEDGTDTCDANAICANTFGGFTCACRQGFTGNGQTCSGPPPVVVGDVSATPIEVLIEGLSSTITIDGLSRLSSVIEVSETPIGPAAEGRTHKDPYRFYVPDITMRGLRATVSQANQIAGLIQQGETAVPRRLVITLVGAGGETVGLGIYGVVPVGGDPTITQAGGVSVVAEITWRVATYEYNPVELEFVLTGSLDTLYNGYTNCPRPGERVEISGIATSTCYPSGGLAIPPAQSSQAIVMRSTGYASDYFDWMEQTVEDWFYPDAYPPFVNRRDLSMIVWDANQEVDRFNAFECFPMRLDYFSPDKPYGQTRLFDLTIATDNIEDA